ncbi:MAG: methylase [Anaerolineae bacterium]|nr:methylase [Anaerolineae bacterium]
MARKIQQPAAGRRQKPLGQPTRGKTASNRLRRVDNFLLLYDPGLLRRQDGPWRGALFVDLGYGDEPVTTLESAARLRRVNPSLPVLGVEIDPARVAAAQPFADNLTQFRLGGFNLPLQLQPDGTPETVRLIRAFNVLRQYREEDVAPAWAMLGRYLLPGGLLIEGTAEPFGRIWAANLLRKPAGGGELVVEGLLFSTNFRLGFDPAEFQTILPKNLIHRVTPGEPIYAFFAAWKRAAQATVPWRGFGLRQWFIASAHRLAEEGFRVDLRRRLLAQGYLLVRGPATNDPDAPRSHPLVRTS